MFKAAIRFGDVRIPVKLYAAARDARTRFRLLHAVDHVPVRQRMVHAETGEEVPAEQARRGWEVEPGVYVLLDDEELEERAPEPTRDVEITRFVEPRAVPPALHERPYHLGPDGDAEAYAAVAAALARRGRCGIARWVMRNKRYNGALCVRDGRLSLVTLRPPELVVLPAELPAPEGRDLDRRELRLAEQLLEQLEDEPDLSELRDEYAERVRELVRKKSRGETVEVARAPAARPAAASLRDALERSVREAKKRKKKVG